MECHVVIVIVIDVTTIIRGRVVRLAMIIVVVRLVYLCVYLFAALQHSKLPVILEKI